jgi:2-haloacid dehalogenase
LITTLAFDVYGTLIDTAGVVTELDSLVGDRAVEFARLWREKQLEYSFRRGLMQNYADFSVCTRDALDYACGHHGLAMGQQDKERLLAAYRTLPAFTDAAPGLENLKGEPYRLFAFSNGSAAAVGQLLRHAGLAEYFEEVISVDEIKSFKPNPAVYCLFLRRAGAAGSESWLISSNPFDVIGAISAGMRAAWVKRDPKAIFDPWDIRPTRTLNSLLELPDVIAAAGSSAEPGTGG